MIIIIKISLSLQALLMQADVSCNHERGREFKKPGSYGDFRGKRGKEQDQKKNGGGDSAGPYKLCK